jgi:serine/threonine-protein kinase
MAPRGADRPDVPVLPAVVAARFRAERLLGRGGMGSVLLAHDLVWGTPVALKIGAVSNPAAAAGLRHEFRAFARLDHPNVARFYDLVGDQQYAAYSMEYVVGVNLGAHVRGGLPPGRRLDPLGSRAARRRGGPAPRGRAGAPRRGPGPP